MFFSVFRTFPGKVQRISENDNYQLDKMSLLICVIHMIHTMKLGGLFSIIGFDDWSHMLSCLRHYPLQHNDIEFIHRFMDSNDLLVKRSREYIISSSKRTTAHNLRHSIDIC